MTSIDAPRDRHRQRLERRASHLERRSRRYSWMRLGIVVTGAVAVFIVFRAGMPNAATLFAAFLVATFAVVVKGHDRVESSLRQTRLLERIKALHERRRALDWTALPGEEQGVDRGPFAVDLNLVGHRSLHHLIDTSTSRGGSLGLADWLTEPDPVAECVRERQGLVRQLVPLGLFRDRLIRLSGFGKDRERWDDAGLHAWLGRREVIPRLRPWLVGLSIFSGVNVLLIVAHVSGWMPPLWPMTILIYFAIYFMKYRSVDDVFEEAQALDMTLERITPPLLTIEGFHFEADSPAAAVTAPIQAAPPSVELATLSRIAAFSAVTRNEFMWLLLNLLLPWELLFTFMMHRTKRSLREHLPRWLETWYTMEAASSLAAYAEYNPQRVFPEFTAVGEPPVFHGVALGHPLLHEEEKVRNDFAVNDLGEVILITGSNMSGKSTFLRTVGANLRLAYAGGPVDADAMQTSCFRVFTSINVVDSVQEGLSHFYAEVQRLKHLLEALSVDESGPMLNLIDEIFRGTNNRERLIGSRAFIQELAGRRAVSFISTHDLELTALEEEIPELRNYHFREDVSGDRMTFDYTIRRGPCPTTNALKIMAQAGLPVGSVSRREP